MADMRIRLDDKAVRDLLKSLPVKQIPFAVADGINRLAKRVQAAETSAMPTLFHKATPFTLRGIAVQGATKAVPYAVILVKDVQAQYLSPLEFGGPQFLGKKKALLNPKDIKVNQYGNLPKGALQRLKGRKDVFIGTIVTKSGPIAGVWQAAAYKAKREKGARTAGGNMKLLIRWGNPQPVKPVFHFGTRAQQVVMQHWREDFDAAMVKALATAK